MEIPVFDIAEDQKYRIYLIGFPSIKRDNDSRSAIVDTVPNLVPEAKVYQHDIFHQSSVRNGGHEEQHTAAPEEPTPDAGSVEAASSDAPSVDGFDELLFSPAWIDTEAENLLHRIHRHQTSQGSRPVLLAGHGFGGFVVKKAIVLGNTNPQFYDISLAVTNLLFFDTPHADMPLQQGQNHGKNGRQHSQHRACRKGESGETDNYTEDDTDTDTDTDTNIDIDNAASGTATHDTRWENTLLNMLKNTEIPYQERLSDLLSALVDGVVHLSYSFAQFSAKYDTVNIIRGHDIEEPHEVHVSGGFFSCYVQWPGHDPDSLALCTTDSVQEMCVLRQQFAPRAVLSSQILAVHAGRLGLDPDLPSLRTDDDDDLYLRTLHTLAPSRRMFYEMRTLDMLDDYNNLRRLYHAYFTKLAWARARGGSVQVIGPAGQDKSFFVKLISQMYRAEDSVVAIEYPASLLESHRRSLYGVLASTLHQILSQRPVLFRPIHRIIALIRARDAWSTELLAAVLSVVFHHAEGVNFLVVVYDFEKWPENVQQWWLQLRNLINQAPRTLVTFYGTKVYELFGSSCTFLTSSEEGVNTPDGVPVLDIKIGGHDSKHRRKWIQHKTKQLLRRHLKAKAISPRLAEHVRRLIVDAAQDFDGPIFSIDAYISYLYWCLGVSSPIIMNKVIQESPRDQRSLVQKRISALFKNKNGPATAYNASWSTAVLSWMLLAFRELRVEELAAAAAIELQYADLADLREDICIDIESDLHLILHDIVIVENKYARIVSPEMRDSLLKDNAQHGFCVIPHRTLAMRCLHYLYIVLHDTSPDTWSKCAALASHNHRRPAPAEPELEFLNYACRSWPAHFLVGISETEASLAELGAFVSQVFQSENVFRRWFWLNAVFRGYLNVPDDINVWLEPEKTAAPLTEGGGDIGAEQEGRKGERKSTCTGEGDAVIEVEKKKESSSHTHPLPDSAIPSSRAFVNALIDLGNKGGRAVMECAWNDWEDDLFRWDTTVVSNSGLYRAIARNDLGKIQNLLSADASNQSSEFFPLHHAVFVGSVSTIKLVAQLVADPAQTDQDGATALHIAAACNRKDALQALLGDPPSPEGTGTEAGEKAPAKDSVLDISVANVQDNRGRTALIEATRSGSIDAALFLLGHKVSAAPQDEYGQTSLHCAVISCSEAVDGLVSLDPSALFIKDKSGRWPLHYASLCGNVIAADIIRRKVWKDGRLIDVCYGTDGNGYTAIEHAVEHGFTTVVSVLGDVLGALDPTSPAVKAAAHGYLDTVRICDRELELLFDPSDKGPATEVIQLAAASRNGQLAAVLRLLKESISPDGSEEYRPICLAAIGGHEEVIRVLLRHKADINLSNAKRETALHLAAIHKRHGVAETLLKYDDSPDNTNTVNIHLRDQLRQTPLHCAQDAFTVKLFLEHGASVDSYSSTTRTPLHTAVRNAEVVEALLQAQPPAKIDAKDMANRTPLHLAAATGYLESVRVLIKYNANVDLSDDAGHTPLQAAVKNNFLDVVKELISGKERKQWATFENLSIAIMSSAESVVNFILGEAPEIVQSKEAPGDNEPEDVLGDDESRGKAEKRQQQRQSELLHSAAARHSVKILRLLLDLKLPIDIRDSLGRTPLITAVKENCTENARLLIERRADITAMDNTYSMALHCAATINSYQSVDDLIVAGAPVYATRCDGWTPLFCAVYCGSLESAQRLLKEKADIGVTNVDGWSLLHAAADSYKITEMLLRHGADVNYQKGDGYSPLHMAALWKQPQIVKILMDYGADPNAENKQNKTPFHLALEKGSSKCVEAMLDHERANVIDFNKRTANGYNSLQLAVQLCEKGIVERLLSIDTVINAEGAGNGKCLSLATSNTKEEILKLLLDHASLWSPQDLVDAYWACTENGSLGLEAILEKNKALVKEKNAQGQNGLQVYLRPRNMWCILSSRFARVLLESGIDPWYSEKPDAKSAFELGLKVRDQLKGDFVQLCIDRFPANALEAGLGFQGIRVATEVDSIELWGKMMPLLSPIVPQDADSDDWNLHHFVHQALPKLGPLNSIKATPDMYEKATRKPSAMVVLPEWVRYLDDIDKAVTIGEDGLNITFEKSDKARRNRKEDIRALYWWPLVVRANHPLPPRTTAMSYFEVAIQSATESDEETSQTAEPAEEEAGNGRNSRSSTGSARSNSSETAVFSIGLVGECTTMITAHVGWNIYSVGLHSDDGLVQEANMGIKDAGDPSTYGPGDTIGCGVDYRGREGSYFFTRNGCVVARAARKIIYRKLYPAIGHDDGRAVVSVNFGGKPFMYKEANKTGSTKRTGSSSSTGIRRTPTFRGL